MAAMEKSGPASLRIVEMLRENPDRITDEWRELCRWDPMLPPNTTPPIAPALISALADALEHPQPLGWGADPEMEKVVGAFTLSAGSLDLAIGELVCLGEALRRRLFAQIPPEEAGETHMRVEMIIDRAIGVAAQQAAEQAESRSLIDPDTGLLNRRALERDLRRELARCVRYRRTMCVMVLCVPNPDGLPLVAAGLRDGVRAGDLAYRLGDRELAAVLAESEADVGLAVAARLDGERPGFTVGTAAYPEDGDDPEELLELARARAVRGA
jgi:GGDEF domain-containing protein